MACSLWLYLSQTEKSSKESRLMAKKLSVDSSRRKCFTAELTSQTVWIRPWRSNTRLAVKQISTAKKNRARIMNRASTHAKSSLARFKKTLVYLTATKTSTVRKIQKSSTESVQAAKNFYTYLSLPRRTVSYLCKLLCSLYRTKWLLWST